MISHKGQEFRALWRRVLVVLGTSMALAGYLLWRYDSLWPLLLLGGSMLYLMVSFRVVGVKLQSAMQELDESSQALEGQSKRLSAIHEIADALSEAVELPELLGQGLERTVRALGLEGGQIHLKSDDRDQVMHIGAIFGDDTHFWDGEQTIQVGECICGQAAAAGSPVVVNDAMSDSRIAGRACAVGGVPSVASVPLRVKGGTLGVLTVRSCDPHHFVLQDLELLTSVANLMAAALENARIRTKMQDRIAELSAEEQQLVIVEERQRIGREMHDGLAQTLGLLNVQIEMVKSAAKMEDWAAAEDELARLDSYLSNAYGDVRQALSDLRRTAMQGESFISGLRDYVQEFGVRNKLEAVLLTRNGDESICLPALVEVHLQRVIQEALTNVRRHAGASQVIVRMHSSSEGWDVMVSDDGIGFDRDQLATTRGRYGLLTMQERVESVGGSFSIDSQPGAGTRIMVSVPCNSGNRG